MIIPAILLALGLSLGSGVRARVRTRRGVGRVARRRIRAASLGSGRRVNHQRRQPRRRAA